MRAGRLDKRLTFQRTSTGRVRNAFGEYTSAESTGWSDYATVWGSLQPVSASERFDSAVEIERETAVVEIRYRTDIDGEMRIKWVDPRSGSTHIYDIQGPPIEVGGRREGLQMEVIKRAP